MMTKDQMREKIRAELTKEIKNPGIWYPISKKNRDKLNKLTACLKEKEEK